MSAPGELTIDAHLSQRGGAQRRLSHRTSRAEYPQHSGRDRALPDIGTDAWSTPTTPHGHPVGRPHSLHRPRTAQTPLPIKGLMPLCLARVSEGLIYAVIFPYINELMHDFGVAEEQIGVWSAIAESTLMATEAITAPMYAPLADRFGRRTVFVPLVFLWGLFALLFGFAGSPFTVVVLRACLGLLAGAGVISRTIVGEMCDRTNRIRSFAVFSPAFIIGVTIAPLIGGFLSKPVPRLLPASFTLFATYPYLLPAIVTGFSGFGAAIWSYYTLPESREEAEKAAAAGGFWALVTFPRFQHILLLYGGLGAIMFSFEAIFPLFAYTGKELGGLGLTTQTIGVVLSAGASMSIVMTIFLFPVLHERLDEATLFRLCLLAYPAAVLLFPLLWALSLSPGDPGMGVWLLLALQMFLRRFGDFTSTLLDTLVLDAIPGPEYLAMGNSATFSVAAVGRAVGPLIVSAFFSLSTMAQSAHDLKRQLVWVVFVLVCVPSLWIAQKVVEDIAAAATAADEEERQELLPLHGSAVEEDEIE